MSLSSYRREDVTVSEAEKIGLAVALRVRDRVCLTVRDRGEILEGVTVVVRDQAP